MQRLSKVLAGIGIASRRACEEIIESGRVQVNGETILVPQTKVDIKKDVIICDGTRVKSLPEKVVFALNKPVGFICTTDPRVKRQAVSLIDSNVPRLFTVGRLDKETSGLIIVTNDGHLANRIMHPSFQVAKEYIAHVDKEVLPAHLVAMSKGIYIEGYLIKPLQVTKIRKGTVRVVICDGKKHEVRLLLAAQGFKVVELKRIRIGNLSLGGLPEGGYKRLSASEIESIIEKSKDNPKKEKSKTTGE